MCLGIPGRGHRDPRRRRAADGQGGLRRRAQGRLPCLPARGAARRLRDHPRRLRDQRVDEDEALKTLEILAQMGDLVQAELATMGPGWTCRRWSPTTGRRSPAPSRHRRRERPEAAREVPRRVPRPGPRPEARRRDPPDHDAAVDAHGGLRRPDPHDRQAGDRRGAARGRPDDPRARLPGLRHAARADRQGARDRRPSGRHLHQLRRHAARARARRRTCSRSRPAAPTCGSSTRRSTR